MINSSQGDEVQPEASTESTGPDLFQHNSSGKEEETEDDFPENAPSKGHSLIVKSRDSKNKVSLVIKPLESSTEEPLESNTEQTVEFMSEDHVKSSSEESPKPAENNESSSSRPMDHGSGAVQQNDLLSKLVDNTITDKQPKVSSSMYLTEEEINRLPIDLGNPKPPANDTGHATMNPDLPLQSTSLPHDIESLMTNILGPNNAGTQRQEQEIQKIKNSLAAGFELEKQTKQPMWQQQHPQQRQQQQQHQK